MRTKNYLYVRYADGEKEFYDSERDSHQLASSYPEAGDALEDRLLGWLSSLASCAEAQCSSGLLFSICSPKAFLLSNLLA